MRLSLLALPALAAATPWSLEERAVTCNKTGINSNRAIIINREFLVNNLIGDVVPDIQPTTELRGAYGSKQINLGNTYQVFETLEPPTFDFDPEEGHDPETTRYTFVILDPDAPGPGLPLLRQFLHFIVSDVAPSCVSGAQPKTVTPYMPLTPLSLAKHRYTLLLYRQPPGPFTPKIPGGPITQVTRAPFKLDDFVSQNNLTLVSGNYFKEGLASLLDPLIPPQLKGLLPLPGFSTTGVGYNGPLDGTAEPANGIGDLIKKVPALASTGDS